jgi:hypothetical protein
MPYYELGSKDPRYIIRSRSRNRPNQQVPSANRRRIAQFSDGASVLRYERDAKTALPLAPKTGCC